MQIIEHAWAWRGGLTRRGRTDAIVLHHAAAATASAEEIHNAHLRNGWTGIGYHYYVRKNGEIHRGRPEWAIGAHAAVCNSSTIGVCAEGNYETETAMPPAQLAALRALVADIRRRYPQAAIRRHRDYMSTACPGKYYPFEAVRTAPQKEDDMTEAQTRAIVREEIEKATGSAATLPASHWGYTHWNEAKARGITDGTRPLAHITRLECATMILNALKKVMGVK